jgi:aarF domain-containing kinase
MQTDPNWANFLYDEKANKINLIDFGASRSFSKDFVDKYTRILHAASKNDSKEILKWSREAKFLTGYESKVGLLFEENKN